MYQANYEDYHSDGLVDIFIGGAMTLIAIALLANILIMIIWIPAGFLPLYDNAKKSITKSRIGELKHIPDWPKKERTQRRILSVVIFAILAAGFILFVNRAGGDEKWLEIIDYAGGWPLFTALAVLMLVAGKIFELNRLYAYAGLILVMYLVGIEYNLSRELILLIPGAIILLTGGSMLLGFVRQYPMQSKRENQK